MRSQFALVIIICFLLGSCTTMAGGIDHWPAMVLATVAIIGLKIFNDKRKILAWPMEFLLFAAVTMIVMNLAWLYFLPLPE